LGASQLCSKRGSRQLNSKVASKAEALYRMLLHPSKLYNLCNSFVVERNVLERAKTVLHMGTLFAVGKPELSNKVMSYTESEKMKNAVFCDVTTCGSFKNRRFGDMYFLHYWDEKNQRYK
jgi:hypothetical protein